MNTPVSIRGILAAVALAGMASGAAAAPPAPSVEVMSFAPPNTDIVLRADMGVLVPLLKKTTAFPPSRDALAKLEQLRSGIGVPGIKSLDISVVYTFHVRDTDTQLAAFELNTPPQELRGIPPALAQYAMTTKAGHTFILWSRLKGLARQVLAQSGGSQLSPALMASVRELKEKAFFAAMDMTEARRALIHKLSGAPGQTIPPQIAKLQLIEAVVSDLKPTSVTVELILTYPSAGAVESFRDGFAGSLPFPNLGGREIRQENERIRVIQKDLSFSKLNEFLSRF